MNSCESLKSSTELDIVFIALLPQFLIYTEMKIFHYFPYALPTSPLHNINSDLWHYIYRLLYLSLIIIQTFNKPWLTTGIRKSCSNKVKLYQILKYNKNPSFRLYFNKYCRILKSTIEIKKKNILIP